YILRNLDPGEEHVTGLDILEEGVVVVIGIGGREGQRVVGYRGAPFARTRDGGQAVLGKFAIEPQAAIVRIGGRAATAAERNHRADSSRTGSSRSLYTSWEVTSTESTDVATCRVWNRALREVRSGNSGELRRVEGSRVAEGDGRA